MNPEGALVHPRQSTLDHEHTARPEKGSKVVGSQRSEKIALVNKTWLSEAPYLCFSRDRRRNVSTSFQPLASDTHFPEVFADRKVGSSLGLIFVLYQASKSLGISWKTEEDPVEFLLALGLNQLLGTACLRGQNF